MQNIFKYALISHGEVLIYLGFRKKNTFCKSISRKDKEKLCPSNKSALFWVWEKLVESSPQETLFFFSTTNSVNL